MRDWKKHFQDKKSKLKKKYRKRVPSTNPDKPGKVVNGPIGSRGSNE